MVVLNEGLNNVPSRYPMLKQYVLDHVEDVDVYGKWVHEEALKDPRFKGPKPFSELQKMLPKVKYTFCIPIQKGWVTAKFWEMAHYGIIPFLHPDYDKQDNLKVPDILRVKNSKDLYEKIEFLENNPDEYDKLRAEIDAMIKDDYYTGEHLNKLTNDFLEKVIEKNG